MMEELVPSASAAGHSNTSGPTRRQTRAESPNNETRANAHTNTHAHSTSTSIPIDYNDNYDDHDHGHGHERPRRRRNMLGLSLASLSPTLVISKLLLFISFVLQILLFPVRKIMFLLFPLGEFDNVSSASVSTLAAKAFVKMFHSTYIQPLVMNPASVTTMSTDDDDEDANDADANDSTVDRSNLTCPFVEAGYTETINDIANKARLHNTDPNPNPPAPLLLIYLHSPLHGKVPSFLSNTLCNPRILSLMNQNVNTGILSCWGGSIHTADGANAQDTLQVSSYPFLALLTVQPSSSSSSSSSSRNNNNTNQLQEKKLELHLRMEGTELQNISPDTLHNHLSNTLGGYQQILSEQAMRRLVRQQESDLIQQQNDEYEAALAADRAREREREEERQRLEEERQKVEQEEMIQRQKLEQEERTQRQILQNAKDLLAKGEPSQNEANCATIRLTLPNGKRVARRFRATDTIHVVRAFLTVYFEENGVDIQNFSLNSNYPKKALVHVDATVESEGLCPQAVIMVQDLDA